MAGSYPWYVQVATNQSAIILLIGAAQLGIIFKRKLSELKVVSLIFFGFVLTFDFLLFTELISDSETVAETVDFDELSQVKFDKHMLTAISIMLFAYSVQYMVFPAYVELEKRSTERFSQASLI